MRPAWVATGNRGHCLVSVSPEMVPLSVLEVGGPSVPVPTKVSENPPVTTIEFPEMTPVKVMVNGLVPPLDKLALMFPFVPVTDPVMGCQSCPHKSPLLQRRKAVVDSALLREATIPSVKLHHSIC
jgi:hypothetical protein